MYTSVPFDWLSNHLHLIGWPTLIYACYRIIKVTFRFGRAATLVEQRVLDGEATLHLVATNHLPHLELAMQDTNKSVQNMHETLRGLRDDLRMLMVKD
jgi:hypothetical protein